MPRSRRTMPHRGAPRSEGPLPFPFPRLILELLLRYFRQGYAISRAPQSDKPAIRNQAFGRFARALRPDFAPSLAEPWRQPGPGTGSIDAFCCRPARDRFLRACFRDAGAAGAADPARCRAEGSHPRLDQSVSPQSAAGSRAARGARHEPARPAHRHRRRGRACRLHRRHSREQSRQGGCADRESVSATAGASMGDRARDRVFGPAGLAHHPAAQRRAHAAAARDDRAVSRRQAADARSVSDREGRDLGREIPQLYPAGEAFLEVRRRSRRNSRRTCSTRCGAISTRPAITVRSRAWC